MGARKSKSKHGLAYDSDTAGRVSGELNDVNNVKEFQKVHSDRVTSLTVFNRGICLSGSCDTVRVVVNVVVVDVLCSM